MEINVNDKKEKEKNQIIYFHKFLTLFGVILLLLLLSYTFYIIEKYILFYPIYLLVKNFFDILFHSEYLNIYLIILSLFIVVFFQILFIKIIILSIIFLGGGLFSRFTFYDSFENFINQQKDLAKEVIDSLYFSLNEYAKNDLDKLM